MDRQALGECLVDGPSQELLQVVKHGQANDIFSLLDAELTRSAKRLQRLKEYRNTIRSPFYALSSELHSHIFLIYAIENDALWDLRWTKILLVCRRWHDIGINTPKLWSHIRLFSTTYSETSRGSDSGSSDVRRIELQRSRAGRAGLTVRMNLLGNIADLKRPYLPMFWDPQSLYSLTLFGATIRVAETLRAMALHPHSALEKLDVSTNYSRDELESSRMLLDNVLKQCSSRLQCLSISNALFSWPLLKGLRELRVNLTTPTSVQHHIQDIVSALARCPLLETLRLHLSEGSVSATIDPIPIILTRLSSAHITANSHVCCTILHALKDLPQSAQIATSAFDMADMGAVSSYLGNRTQANHSPVIRGLGVETLPMHVYQSAYGITGLLYLEQFPKFNAQLSAAGLYAGLLICAEVDNDAIHVLLLGAMQSWALSNVTWLDLRKCMFVAGDSFWNDVLASVPTVNTVILSAGDEFISSFLQILHISLRMHGKRFVPNIVVDMGVVRDKGSASVVHGYDSGFAGYKTMSVMRVLIYCAEAARAGCALDTVEVVNDYVQPSCALIDIGADPDWNELYQDLNEGFVYESVLRRSSLAAEGVKRDFFGDHAQNQPSYA